MRKFPTLRVGDGLKCSHINQIYRELERLSKAHGDGSGVTISGLDGPEPPVFKLTSSDDLIPVLYPTGIGAGTYTSPSSKSDVIRLRPNGPGFATTGTGDPILVYNSYGTAVVGANKFGYVRHRGGNVYDHVVGDC